MSAPLRAVVTGATSFLGSATAIALMEAGHSVLSAARPGSANLDRLPDDDRMDFLPLRLCDMAKAEKYVGRADIWYHFAWDATSPARRNDPDAQAENVRHALEALIAAANTGAKRFVFPGSQAEYGVHEGVITEETPCAPVSEYGRAKLAFEELAAPLAEKAGVELVRLRIFSVYGRGDHAGSLISSCVDTLGAGGDMRVGDAMQTWNYLNIRDFAALMLRVLEAERAEGLYNVGGTDTRRLKDFIEEVHALCGGRGRVLYGEAPARPEGRVQLDPDISRAEAAFGWTPEVSFADGIREMLEKPPKHSGF